MYSFYIFLDVNANNFVFHLKKKIVILASMHLTKIHFTLMSFTGGGR